ncbi:YHYH protein [Flavicella sp.]|uniref:YHYH protein n=1 Tax=Flavicella sp. TaxID=2957742 RepID=UPI0026181989|nr:YHYH protein [Flavicella sp.]MDG1804152.1 YHYH protein [Flavicella sp.]
MKPLHLIISSILLINNWTYSQCDSAAIFAEESDNAVCTEIIGNVKYVYANSIPNHAAGGLNGNFSVLGQDDTWAMCAYPTQGASTTQLYGDDEAQGCSTSGSYKFGVAENGVLYAPSSTEYFEILDSDTGVATGEYNYDWNIEAVKAFGMNSQGAHLNAKGEYHYHSISIDYFTKTNGVNLGIDGTSFSPIVGYAADGFPVYYKYAYTDANDSNSAIIAFDSGWQLKSGNRPGDSFSAPGGAYDDEPNDENGDDGLYIEDYEFIQANTDLDECNGRYGVTPDYPQGTYYYVLTDSWPYIPRCFNGAHVDESFLIGPANVCPASSADTSCSANPSLSAQKINFVNGIKVYPTVVTRSFEILTPINTNQENYQLELLNSMGILVFQKENLKTQDISSLPNGVYYLKISVENTSVIKKIIINSQSNN